MVNEKPSQRFDNAECKFLHIECVPSLKMSFLDCLAACGFRTQTDAIITLVRDLVAGKIQYRGGVLQNQQKNSHPDDTTGQEGLSPPHTEENLKPAMAE